jgi:hypothetical protein
MIKHWADRCESVVRRSDDNQEIAGSSPGWAAADRRVHERVPGIVEPVGQRPGCRWADGAGQDHRRAGAQGLNHPVLADESGFGLALITNRQ